MGTVQNIVRPNSSIRQIAFSAAGRYVLFSTSATNFVDGVTTARTGWSRISISGIASEERIQALTRADNSIRPNASISADGRFVTFDSLATNLIGADTNGLTDVSRLDRTTGRISRLITSTTSHNALEAGIGTSFCAITSMAAHARYSVSRPKDS